MISAIFERGDEMIIGGSVSIYIVDCTVDVDINISKLVLNGKEYKNIHVLDLDRYKYTWSLKNNKNSGIEDPQYPMNLINTLRSLHGKKNECNVLLKMDTTDKSNDKLLQDIISNTRGYIFNDKTNTDHMDLLMHTMYYNYIGYYCCFGIKDGVLTAL